jgi:hypothetical protein
MLVNKEFIYVSLPRCASTSFLIACGQSGLKVNHFSEILDDAYNNTNWHTDSELIAKYIPHSHEKLTKLKSKFGNNYNIISVKRNRHERFISTIKHVVDVLYKIDEANIANYFEKLSTNELLIYTSEEISNVQKRENIINYFIKIFINKNLLKNVENINYIESMIRIIILPTFYYHHHNSEIIWFDFEKLNELEDWVSNKLSINFKLKQNNSSKNFKIKIKLDDNFIKKYNEIYDIFDFEKIKKTII